MDFFINQAGFFSVSVDRDLISLVEKYSKQLLSFLYGN